MTDGRDLLDHARTLALLNLALADAGIAAWDAKYHYDTWRPIDAIRRAAEDSNALTVAAVTWSPLLKTPAFPSFVSGHSTFSAAAATVLTHLYGDRVSFMSTTDPQSGLTQRPLAPELIATRSFTSFWQAAEEAGRSRIYGGIHYAFDNTAGLELGRAISETVVNSRLGYV
jgi:membrane-associated phospholipid phosphatase